MNAVIAIERSANKKIGDASATYVSQSSCPASCPFMGNGCYAESGPIGIHTSRLNRSNISSVVELAKQEAASIQEKLTGRYPLRLHVVGDCSTDEAASIVSEAVVSYRKPVWTYTHAWKDVKRESWKRVSVLASVETVADIPKARQNGYATAIVVDQHPSVSKYKIGNEQVIPCPAETKGVKCTDCKLCWDDTRLRDNKLTIGFAAHGIGAKKVRQAIASNP